MLGSRIFSGPLFTALLQVVTTSKGLCSWAWGEAQELLQPPGNARASAQGSGSSRALSCPQP